MSDCILCGKPAGFFHSKHHKCAETYASSRRQITHLIYDSPSSMDSIGSIASQVIQIAARSFISEPERKDLCLKAWSLAVDDVLDPRRSQRGSRKTVGRVERGPIAFVGGLNTHGRVGANG